MFQEYEVSLGISLDGPQEINAAQRSPGYFKKTIARIELARSHGLSKGCICTFTSHFADRAEEIFDFFLREGIGFSIHAALPTLDRPGAGYALSPEGYSRTRLNRAICPSLGGAALIAFLFPQAGIIKKIDEACNTLVYCNAISVKRGLLHGHRK